MPKISGYPNGGALQDTDQIVVNRGGKNYRVVNVLTEVIGTFMGVTVPAATTYTSSPFKSTADAVIHNIPWPEGGVLKNMLFRLGTNQPATGSLVITLLINNVATALVITVPAGSAFGNFSDLVNQVTLSPFDLLRWTFLNNATSASGQLNSIAMTLVKN